MFGIRVDIPTIVLVAFLEGEATPKGSPQITVLPKMLYRSLGMRATGLSAAFLASPVPFCGWRSAFSARQAAWPTHPSCVWVASLQRCRARHAAVLPTRLYAGHSIAPWPPSARERGRERGRYRRSPATPPRPQGLRQRTIRRCCLRRGSAEQTSCRRWPYRPPRRPDCCPTAASPPHGEGAAGRRVRFRCPCQSMASTGQTVDCPGTREL